MLKDLLEGIVVPPTIGGQPRLSLPKVIGITVSPGEGGGTNIVIEIQPVEASTQAIVDTLAGDPDNEVSVKERTDGGRVQYTFPLIEFNIGDYINIEGLEPPYNVSLLKVTEKKYNRDGNLYTPDNPYLTMDENGNVKYTPRGFFRDNILYLDVEIVGEGAPPSAPAKKRRRVYEPKRSKNIAGAPEAPEGVAGRPGNLGEAEDDEKLRNRIIIDQETKKPIVVVLKDTTIGKSIEDVEGDHVWQGFDGTCYIVSIGMLLRSVGITNEDGTPLMYEDVLDLFAIEVDPVSGEIIGELPPVVVKDFGTNPVAAYIKYIDPATGKYRAEWSHRLEEKRGIPVMPDEKIPDSAVGINWIKNISDAFPNIKVGIDRLTPIELIAKLARGESLVVTVDDYELDKRSPLLSSVDQPTGTVNGQKVNHAINHAVVVHGLEQDIKGDWWVVVNDPNQKGSAIFDPDKPRRAGSSLVRLQTFFEAAEDGGMWTLSMENTADTSRGLNSQIPNQDSLTNQRRTRYRFENLVMDYVNYGTTQEQIIDIYGVGEENRDRSAIIKYVLETPALLEGLLAHQGEPGSEDRETFITDLRTYQAGEKTLEKILEETFPGLDISAIEDVWRSVQGDAVV